MSKSLFEDFLQADDSVNTTEFGTEGAGDDPIDEDLSALETEVNSATYGQEAPSTVRVEIDDSAFRQALLGTIGIDSAEMIRALPGDTQHEADALARIIQRHIERNPQGWRMDPETLLGSAIRDAVFESNSQAEAVFISKIEEAFNNRDTGFFTTLGEILSAWKDAAWTRVFVDVPTWIRTVTGTENEPREFVNGLAAVYYFAMLIEQAKQALLSVAPDIPMIDAASFLPTFTYLPELSQKLQNAVVIVDREIPVDVSSAPGGYAEYPSQIEERAPRGRGFGETLTSPQGILAIGYVATIATAVKRLF
jgi:hypothetical protein